MVYCVMLLRTSQQVSIQNIDGSEVCVHGMVALLGFNYNDMVLTNCLSCGW
jgi:hypothetical protein